METEMWKAILVIFIGTLLGSIGDGLLSKGLRDLHQMEWSGGFWSVALQYVRAACHKPTIVFGVMCHASFFGSILMAFSWADLSLVLPISALTYVFAPFIATYFLREDVNSMRWVGAFIIVIGVVTVLLGEAGGPGRGGGKAAVGAPAARLESPAPDLAAASQDER
jgi:drug/metabolite transporter (DMT)-like permease